MTEPVATVPHVDLRSADRRRLLGRRMNPAALRTLLARQLGTDILDGDRLLIIDETRLVPRHVDEIIALAAADSGKRTLLLLTGPPAEELGGTPEGSSPTANGIDRDPSDNVDLPHGLDLDPPGTDQVEEAPPGVDSTAVDSTRVDTPGTEPTESASIGTESIGTESSGTESMDAEPIRADPIDVEPIDTGAVGPRWFREDPFRTDLATRLRLRIGSPVDEREDLDAAYDPALYSDFEVPLRRPRQASAKPDAGGASPARTALPPILWVGDPTGTAAGAAPPAREASAGPPTDGGPGVGGPAPNGTGTAAHRSPGTAARSVQRDGPPLRALLDVLRCPEVFDRVTAETAALPGAVAAPGLRAVVGRLDDDTLRGQLVDAAHRFVDPTGHPVARVLPRSAADPRDALRRWLEGCLADGVGLGAIHRRLAEPSRGHPDAEPFRQDVPAGARAVDHEHEHDHNSNSDALTSGGSEEGTPAAAAAALSALTGEIINEIAAYAETLDEIQPPPAWEETPDVSLRAAHELRSREDDLRLILDLDLVDLTIAMLAPTWDRPDRPAGDRQPGGRGPAAVGRRANDLLDLYVEHLCRTGVLTPPSVGTVPPHQLAAGLRTTLAEEVWRGEAVLAPAATHDAAIRPLVSGPQLSLLDITARPAQLITFAPLAGRPPSSAPDPTDTVVWTATARMAGTVRLVAVHDTALVEAVRGTRP